MSIERLARSNRAGVWASVVAVVVVGWAAFAAPALATTPANVTPPSISGSVTVGATITETPGTWDSSAATITTVWQSCANATCATVQNAGTSYTVQTSDENKTIQVVETAADAANNQATATSNALGPVTVPPPALVNPSVPAIGGTARQGQTLTAATGTWTNNPTYAYAWQRCVASGCTAIPGASASTYLVAAADVGSTVEVTVTATNAGGSASATSAATSAVLMQTVTNAALPTITGVTWSGQTLTESNGAWNPAATSYAYQWERCTSACAAISGATAQAYTLTSADVGATIEVAETANPGSGTPAATSAATAAVTAPLSVSNPPTVSGTAQQGQTLTEGHGRWSPAPSSYGYAWYRCPSNYSSPSECVVIAGATAQTYTPVAADVGAVIYVLETAMSGGGSATGYSAPTGVVTNIANVVPVPAALSAPEISGTPGQGQTLSVVHGSWTNNPIAYFDTWLRCSPGCSPIPGATGTTYTAAPGDVGSTLAVSETATNSGGSGSPVSSAATSLVLASTSTVLTLSATPVAGRPVTLVATITSGSANAHPRGSLTFTANGSPIPGCTGLSVSSDAQTATVLCPTAFPAPAVSLQAAFAAGAGALVTGSTSPATPLSVAPTASTIVLTAPSRVNLGSSVKLTVSVAAPGDQITASGRVTYTDAGRAIPGCVGRVLSAAHATCVVRWSTLGTHRIAASYAGDANFRPAASATTQVRSTPGPAAPVVSALMNWTFANNVGSTQIRQFTVSGLSAGMTIDLTCHGGGCAFGHRVIAVKPARHCARGHGRAVRCRAPTSMALASLFGGRRLLVGTKIVERIAHAHWIGKYYAFTVRGHRRDPAVRISCLAVGLSKPGVGCMAR